MSDGSKSGSPFIFSKLLEGYLQEKLLIEKEIKIKKNSGGRITETDERRIRNNDDKKVRILNNHIFRAMANLIYFFEFLNKHQELDGLFDTDVEDLFGFRG